MENRQERINRLNGNSDLYFLLKEDIEQAKNATSMGFKDVKEELQKTNETLDKMYLLGDRFLMFIEKTTPIVINFTKFLVIVIAVLIAGTTVSKFFHG